ncbi:MAG: lysophospholipid acyltransferase family protein, partial [Acidobacteriota bacterium]
TGEAVARPTPDATVDPIVRLKPDATGDTVGGGSPSNGSRQVLAPWSRTQRFFRTGLGTVLRVATDLRVNGLEWVPAHGPAILAVNHLSSMDVPLAFAVLPRPVIMLAKQELRGSRVLDWLLADIGRAIYVNRGDGGREALDRAIAVLASGGIVALGPEGRRSAAGLTEGHTGVAYLAAQARVPVVPMAAWGQEQLAPSWRRLQRAPINVRFGPPLVFTGASSSGLELRGFTDAVMRAIAAELPPQYRGVYGAGEFASAVGKEVR